MWNRTPESRVKEHEKWGRKRRKAKTGQQGSISPRSHSECIFNLSLQRRAFSRQFPPAMGEGCPWGETLIPPSFRAASLCQLSALPQFQSSEAEKQTYACPWSRKLTVHGAVHHSCGKTEAMSLQETYNTSATQSNKTGMYLLLSHIQACCDYMPPSAT